jgi:hypothetical protein
VKTNQREDAIALRKKGLTYSEILKTVPVAKSTLSLWLRQVRLAKRQEQHLTEKRKAAQMRGGAARRAQRLQTTELILKKARPETGSLSKKELWLVGLVLYWAEGSKEKTYAGANGVDFANTDPRMIRFFVRWLTKCCDVSMRRIYAHLYIHEYQRKSAGEAVTYWSDMSGLATYQITGVYFKRHNPKSNRHNYNKKYYGTLRVRVKSSSELMRKIQGWVEGIDAQNWGIV